MRPRAKHAGAAGIPPKKKHRTDRHALPGRGRRELRRQPFGLTAQIVPQCALHECVDVHVAKTGSRFRPAHSPLVAEHEVTHTLVNPIPEVDPQLENQQPAKSNNKIGSRKDEGRSWIGDCGLRSANGLRSSWLFVAEQRRGPERYKESRSDDRVPGDIMPLTLSRETAGRSDPDEKKRADAIRNEGSRGRRENEQ